MAPFVIASMSTLTILAAKARAVATEVSESNGSGMETPLTILGLVILGMILLTVLTARPEVKEPYRPTHENNNTDPHDTYTECDCECHDDED